MSRPDEDAVPEDSGSGKEFATGQSAEADAEHAEERTGGAGSGQQFSRGQSDVTEPGDETATEHRGSGKQFSRGQSPEAEHDDEDDRGDAEPGSGKQWEPPPRDPS